MDKHQSKSGLALAGVIVGAIALALSAVPIINNFAFVLAGLALVFGIVGLVQVSKGKRDGRGRAVASIILAVIVIIVVLVSQMMYSRAINDATEGLEEATSEMSENLDRMGGGMTEELLENDVNVELGEFTIEEGDFITNTALPVTVTNRHEESKSYSINIEAVDSNGNRIADDTIYANGLGAGQTQEFEAFQFVQSDKVEALRDAEFKILSVSQT